VIPCQEDNRDFGTPDLPAHPVTIPVPRMRFPDSRVQTLLAACCKLALRPAGFTSRDLRHLLAPSWENIRGDVRRPGQLRPAPTLRLPDHRAHPGQPQLTGQCRRPVHGPVLHPAEQARIIPHSQRSPVPGPPPGSPLRQADRAYKAAIAALRLPGLTRYPALIRHQALLTSGTGRNTQPKLGRLKSLRGKITCCCQLRRGKGDVGGAIRRSGRVRTRRRRLRTPALRPSLMGRYGSPGHLPVFSGRQDNF